MLSEIQKKLAVPKNQHNDFGGFNYRSAEDILSAVKPLLPEGWSLLCNSVPEEIGGYVYQTCTVTLSNGEKTFEATASAREPESKKGMDASQISGAAISYAKKYALGNLFAIDNEKDADSMEPEKEVTQDDLMVAFTDLAFAKGMDNTKDFRAPYFADDNGNKRTFAQIKEILEKEYNSLATNL